MNFSKIILIIIVASFFLTVGFLIDKSLQTEKSNPTENKASTENNIPENSVPENNFPGENEVIGSQEEVEATTSFPLEISVEKVGILSSPEVSDGAYVVTAKFILDGEPVSGAEIAVVILSPNGKSYWFNDASNKLKDVVEAKGAEFKNEISWVTSSAFGGKENDGVYANFMEIGDYDFGATPCTTTTWTIIMYAKKGDRNISQEFKKDIYQCAEGIHSEKAREMGYQTDFGHWMKYVDLDTSTPEEDWEIHANPGQRFESEIIFDETQLCTGSCVYYIRGWGKPLDDWEGVFWNIDSGGTGWEKNVVRKWSWVAPATPGVYSISLNEIFYYRWPNYGEGEFFTGRVIVK